MRLGKKGEDAAAYYFSTRGFELLDRNYRCPIGELDMVVRDGNTVVFVEVKTRSGLAYGLPCESITQTKKNRIRKIVEYYAMAKRLEGKDLRIDVLEILIVKGTYYINHIENAF